MRPQADSTKWHGLLFDILVGGLIGAALGLIASWNLMILLGVERGYEASLADAFTHSLLAGAASLSVLLGGPVLGVWVLRRRRSKREIRQWKRSEHGPIG